MDEKEQQSVLMSAMTTEHFVLQTAANGTLTEAATRASIYVVSLSSSLVAMGFASQNHAGFFPFVATVLPAVFVLGVFTVFRLVDLGTEHMQYLSGIARIRAYYRTLTPDAAVYFSAETGRWPEGRSTPALRLGALVGFLTTAASMIAFIDSVVAGAVAALIARELLGSGSTVIALAIGGIAAAIVMGGFFAYQRWRIMALQPGESSAQRPAR